MRQFRQRVGLVHELRKLRRTEELFDRRDNGTDIDQCLRRDRFDILNRHAFANDAFQTQQSDAELILQQFSDRTDAAVAQMVDVVFRNHAGHDFEQTADNRDHVLTRERALFDRRHF